MRFRRFTEAGVESFRLYLGSLRAGSMRDLPGDLVEDESLTEPLIPEVTAHPVPFATRKEFAIWLNEAFRGANTDPPRLDVGFWTWLTAALFDQVCPADGRGRRRPGADARYIPELTQWTRRYRHLLANPFHVLQLHREEPEKAAVVLVNPLHKPGELTEQFTARLDIVRCPGTMALATRLFIDSQTGLRRRGGSGKAAGRFGKLMNQYTRTWDLQSIETEAFVAMLPREFNRFKSGG